MNLKVQMISLSFKAYVRIDPCELKFVMGLNSWSHTINFAEYVEWGELLNILRKILMMIKDICIYWIYNHGKKVGTHFPILGLKKKRIPCPPMQEYKVMLSEALPNLQPISIGVGKNMVKAKPSNYFS